MGLMKFIEEWFSLAQEIIMRPRDFFSKMQTPRGFYEPMKFALVNIFVGSVLSFMSFFVLTAGSEKLKLIDQILQIVGTDVITIVWMIIPIDLLMSSVVFLMVWLMSIVFMGAVSIFISSAVYHAALKIVGGGKNYLTTFGIVAYVSAFYLISWVPIVNIFVVMYAFYILIVASREVHGITFMRAVVALVPIRISAIVIVFVVTAAIWILANVWVGNPELDFLAQSEPNFMTNNARIIAGLLK